MIPKLQCPRCDSDAIYSYGRTKNGRQRYLCLLCNRQFIKKRSKPEFKKRPLCPLCGRKMHLYMRNKKKIRFRCSDYPQCRGYSVKAVPELFDHGRKILSAG